MKETFLYIYGACASTDIYFMSVRYKTFLYSTSEG